MKIKVYYITLLRTKNETFQNTKKVIENSKQNFSQILLNTLYVKNTVKIWSHNLLPFNVHV